MKRLGRPERDEAARADRETERLEPEREAPNLAPARPPLDVGAPEEDRDEAPRVIVERVGVEVGPEDVVDPHRKEPALDETEPPHVGRAVGPENRVALKELHR